MNPEIVEIRPSELKFAFALKKQLSCSIQLVNNSEEYVAFKVKTTSPKKYTVRPNTGIIFPKSFFSFIVTMQAQEAVPPDMQCRDKFLIQCAEVHSEFSEDDITPDLFIRESGRYIQENKLRVVLVRSPQSTLSLPVNGAEAPIPKSSLKSEVPHESHIRLLQIQIPDKVQNLPPSSMVDESLASPRAKIRQLESKLYDLELKLNEAEKKIARLKDERGDSMKDENAFIRELAVGRQKRPAKVQVGFPFLFVCFISLASMYLGFLLHA